MADKWLFTDEELKRSPSRLAGMSKDEEMANRVNAASLIQEIGDKLTINQLSTNTGIVYMHRFYMKCSFQKFNYTTMSAACLFLAAKVEDQPRKLEYVAKVLNNYNAKQRHSEVNHPSPNSAQEVRDLVEEIAFDEEILLQVLGLQTTVDHPHSQIVNSCAMLKASKEISHSSYVFASTSLVVTTMCLRFPSTVIACVCINIALRWGGFEIKKTSEGKLWYNYVDPTMTLEKLEALSNELASAIEKYPKNLLKRKGVGAKIAGLGPVFSNHPSKNHHHHHKQPHIPSSHPSQKLPTNVRPPNHPFSHHRPSNQTNGNSAAKTTSVPSTTSTITTTTSNASTMSDTTTTATTTTTTTPVVNKMPKLINMQEYKERKQKELKEQQLKIQQQQKEQEIRQEQLKAQQQLKIQQEQEQLKAQQQEQLKIQQQQQQQLKMQQQQQQQLKMQHQQKEQQLKAQQHKEQQHKLQKEQLQPNQQQRELLKQQQNQLIKQQLSKQPLPQQPKDKPRLSTQQLQRPPSSQQKWPKSTSQHTSTSTTRHSLSLNTSLPNLPSLPVQLPIPTSLDVIQHTTTINQPRPSHPISAVTATTTITTSKTFNPLEANVKKHKALSTLLQAEAAKNQQKKLVESAASKAAVSTLNSSINSGSSLNRSMVSNHSKIPETTPRSSNILVNSNNISEIIKSVSSQPFSHHQSSHSEHHHHHPEHHHHTSSHHHQSSNHHHHRDSEHRHSKKHHKEKKKHHHKHHKSKEESKRKHHEDSSLPPIKFKLSNPPVSPPPSESSDLKLKIKDLPNYVVSKDNQSASLSSFQPSLNKEPIKLKISKDKGGHYINPNQSAKSLIEAKKRKHPMDQNGLNIKMPRTDNNDLYPPSI